MILIIKLFIIHIRASDMCAICLSEFYPADETVLLDCRHIHHFHCLSTWVDKTPSCPFCRKQIKSEDEEHITDIAKSYFKISRRLGITHFLISICFIPHSIILQQFASKSTIISWCTLCFANFTFVALVKIRNRMYSTKNILESEFSAIINSVSITFIVMLLFALVMLLGFRNGGHITANDLIFLSSQYTVHGFFLLSLCLERAESSQFSSGKIRLTFSKKNDWQFRRAEEKIEVLGDKYHCYDVCLKMMSYFKVIQLIDF